MIKYIFLAILLPLLCNCGINGEQKATITQSGSSYTYVVVRLEYLQQIKDLCTEANPAVNFTSEELRRAAVSTCTLENMKLFEISVADVMDFQSKYCDTGSEQTQSSDVVAACSALNL